MDIGVTQDAALVLRENRGTVAWLTLNRPAQANALSAAMLSELHAALAAAAADPAVRVVVLAAGGRIFCAGHDLHEMRQHDDPDRHAALFAQCSSVMLLIQSIDKPVIARVQGAAVAAGCQLVATCDLAYAASGARFGVIGIDLGLFCSTPSVALSRAVGRKQAMDMLLTGRLIDAEEAARVGLINGAVPAERLDAIVQDTAERIAAKLPAAIGLGKSLFYRQMTLDTDAAYALAGRTMVDNLRLDAARSCIDDFLARRKSA